MNEYKLEVFLLEKIRLAFSGFGAEFETEITTLIQKFKNPKILTDGDRATALKIFRDGKKHITDAPEEIRGELNLLFGMCISNLEMELDLL